ncbi:MAG TPA: hypothetical protein DIU35_11400 [Candidatus Latescibacteria bacterium]|nr:hypothetical protein [Gemmatimonadota bacterium]HCR18078.1 hypothetical protein [Candidatus Latescibacterota bacterium]
MSFHEDLLGVLVGHFVTKRFHHFRPGVFANVNQGNGYNAGIAVPLAEIHSAFTELDDRSLESTGKILLVVV